MLRMEPFKIEHLSGRVERSNWFRPDEFCLNKTSDIVKTIGLKDY